ncbi:adenosylcobinamide-GDP ribazoletransferase [Jeotgalibacillus soli]|uniref:Adenosylcobinamide-GDP ribazoletransferase n=1 Tax=Jeotgalibacillus soli TaxID=889306 RepID=A0A0C2S6Q5_9BACL|nr:adenosylcobinamide-GDP ribazoletransferase [Jeotgalibacillus soli]KIL49719.1 hypothetical protein KP78_11870 [Jeotgalibacillus soli]
MKKAKLRAPFEGLILAFQFFTTLPIRREISMNEHTIPWMIGSMPIVGAAVGGATIALVHAAATVFDASALITSFVIWISFICWTGGLHLDGWTDVSDAYFSYQSMEKRHEILKDPRVGAFGVLSLVVLLVAKAVFLVDVTHRFGVEAVWLIWIPVLSRLMMALFLVRLPLARKDGLAYFLRQSLKQKHVILPLLTALFLLFLPFIFMHGDWMLLVLLAGGWFIFLIVFIRFAQKEFGGITGDLLGACLEGGELWSWIVVWCYLSIVMV